MRWLLTFLLVFPAAACRRSPAPEADPPLAAEAAPLAPAPLEAAPQGQAAPAPAVGPPAAAAAPPAEAAPEAAPPAVADEESDDEAIYTWKDAAGVVHFGGADEIPDDRRASARKVSGELTIVEAVPTSFTPAAPPADGASSVVVAPAADPAPVKKEPGDKPKLDEQGLPIPGTMKETPHIRAVREATGVQLDPAAVERQYQQQLRDMKCVEKDGAVICG